jgi:predicted nucleic acid-binding protein
MFPLITRAIGRNFRKHWHDGFIAQAAIQYGLTLVTADRKLARAAQAFGATVEFIRRPKLP